jgi:hypothetical protein
MGLHMKAAVVVSTFIFLLCPADARGQERLRVFLESNVGLATGRTAGEYLDNETGIAADLVIGGRIWADRAWIAAVSLSAQGGGPHDDECIPASKGGCVKSFPSFVMIGLPFGYETPAAAALRFSASPVLVRPNFDNWTFGFQGRIDGAAAVLWRISIIASGRVALIPSYEGNSFRLYAFGLGLRLR